MTKTIRLENQKIDIVDKYIYLGHNTRIEMGNQTCELHRYATLCSAAFGKLKNIFISDILTNLKRKASNQCVLPIEMEGNVQVRIHTERQVQERRNTQKNWCWRSNDKNRKTDIELGPPHSKDEGRVVVEESVKVETKNRQKDQRKNTNPLDGWLQKCLHKLDCKSPR